MADLNDDKRVKLIKIPGFLVPQPLRHHLEYVGSSPDEARTDVAYTAMVKNVGKQNVIRIFKGHLQERFMGLAFTADAKLFSTGW